MTSPPALLDLYTQAKKIVGTTDFDKSMEERKKLYFGESKIFNLLLDPYS